jgi:hypothetical protein
VETVVLGIVGKFELHSTEGRGLDAVVQRLPRGWSARFETRVRDGRIEIDRVIVSPEPGQQGNLTSPILGRLDLARVLELLQSHTFAAGQTSETGQPSPVLVAGLGIAGFPEARVGRPPRTLYEDACLARVYLDELAQGGARGLMARVAERYEAHPDRPTREAWVRRRLGRIRDQPGGRGLLTSPGRGRAGGEMTALAEYLLAQGPMREQIENENDPPPELFDEGEDDGRGERRPSTGNRFWDAADSGRWRTKQLVEAARKRDSERP